MNPHRPTLDLEALLAPLDALEPCGANLEYEPEFREIEQAGAGKSEAQYGATLIPATAPDWPLVHEQALLLATRSRDLRLAVWLVRSGARVAGFSFAVRALQLVHGLLQRHWEHVHPQLDASDGNDPTARLCALAPLVHAGGALADLRAAALTPARGSLTVRDIELAIGHVAPVKGEAVPAQDAVVKAVGELIAKSPALGDAMSAGFDAVQGIAEQIDARAGAGRPGARAGDPGALAGEDHAPDFTPLKALLRHVADAVRHVNDNALDGLVGGGAAPAIAARIEAAAPRATRAAADSGIATREDAIRALDRVCEWIDRNEPSHPAPLLIRRAQRLMSKSFIDIIRDLVPDRADEVAKLAGVADTR